jgi:hypothetical protein
LAEAGNKESEEEETLAQDVDCKQDWFGYCHLESCPNLHNACQFFYPQNGFPVFHNESFDYDGKTKSLIVLTFNVNYQVSLPALADYLMTLKPLDVVCIQEMRCDQIVRFLGLLRSKDCPWSYCARSPNSRSFILSTVPVKEVAKKRFPESRNHEFVTVKVQGLFLTCLHLNAKQETIRLT